jgi:exonuclease SbcC
VLNNWLKLNDAIGSKNGNKFRAFAQELTLRRLVALANKHLEKLYGRYVIRTTDEENLELEITDTFQADFSRSMNTLSGGESFLVSLALALGLADLAGRRAQVKTLFIDEGFGSLDENALSTAVSALENLQSEGIKIGIVSHVKELKDRILPQIQIKTGQKGRVSVRIVEQFDN